MHILESMTVADHVRQLLTTICCDCHSQSKDIWRQAAGAAIRAWRDGVKRQKIESMLPILKVEAEMDPMDWPGGMRQQLKVATPLAECVLRGLKAQSGLDGVLRPQFLDSVDAVGRS